MNFNSLPDDCILAIFAELPLKDLLVCVELVCGKWKYLQAISLRQRRRVMLLVGHDPLMPICQSAFTERYSDILVNDDGTRMYRTPSELAKWHGLRCDVLTNQATEWLVHKLPNITILEVSTKTFSHQIFEPLVYLIFCWSAKLATLKVWLHMFTMTCEMLDHELQRHTVNLLWLLIGSINTLPSLKILLLDIDSILWQTYRWMVNRDIMLPILGRLEQFYFGATEQTDIVLKSLVYYALPNPKLHKIGIDDDYISHEHQHQFMALDHRLTCRFTHLLSYIDDDFYPTRQLSTICTIFPSQTILYFNYHDQQISYLEMITSLASLKHLQTFIFHFNNTEEDALKFADNRIQQCDIPQLASVKVLELVFDMKSHHLFTQMNLAWVFPNLQVLKCPLPIGLNCSHCGVDYFSSLAFNRMARDCALALVAPLAQCTKLRMIDGVFIDSYSNKLQFGEFV